MKSRIRKITIIGVGMIGGSIALGIKRVRSTDVTVFGLNSSFRSTHKMLEKGYIDCALDSLQSIPQDSDVVILATPIEVTKNLIPTLAKLNLGKTLFMDVASIKTEIVKIVTSVDNRSFHYISTHPMAGGERTGIDFADPFLFLNKPWVVCCDSIVIKKKSMIADEIIEILGARKIIMSSHMHDKVVLWSSHIPLIISSIVTRCAFSRKESAKIKQTASTGFRDVTRLASHNATFKTELAVNNGENIMRGLTVLKEEIEEVTHMVRKKKSKMLQQYFNSTKNKRDRWLGKQFA